MYNAIFILYSNYFTCYQPNEDRTFLNKQGKV